MDKVFRSTIAAAVFLLCSFSLHAQVDTRGTDFWVTFGNNANTAASALDMQIRIVTTNAATVTFTFTANNTTYTVPVAAGSVYTDTLTAAAKNNVYSDATGTSSKSLHITSDVPISVYALNQRSASADATNVLPVTALGTEYYHISYIPLGGYNDGYTVIATENNTIIYENGMQMAVLQMGEVYSRYATNTDLTGLYITSDKPIAYFANNSCVNIPVGFGACDCLYQQLASVNTWGTNFFVPVSWRTRDIVRIMVSQNGTNITQTGGTLLSATGSQMTLSNLNAGQWVELVVSLDSNGCYIESNNPIGVCTYLTGTNYNNHLPGGSNSDPAQAWLPSIEQTVNSALIAPFTPAVTNLDAHYALVVTPTPTKNNTTVSVGGAADAPLSGGQWYDHSSDYSFYSMPLTNTAASYYYANPAGLLIMGYGTGGAESYYYLAGSSMRSLDVAFYVNEIHNQDLPPVVFDSNQMHFRASILEPMSSNPGHLLWYIDGVPQSAAEDSITWTKNLPNGIYQIKMEVLVADNVTWKIVESTLTIGSPFDITICQGDSVIFDATIYNGGTTPLFQWFKNGMPIAGATDSTYTCAPEDGDVFSCRLVSNADCADPDTVISHTITITFYPKADSTYILTADTVYTCYNTSPELIVQSPLVSDPKFRWYDSQTSNIVLHEGDTFVPTPALLASRSYFVSVHDTTGIVCENDTNNRKEIVVTVIEIVFISVTITASDTDICFGDEVTFTATATGDNSLVYQWKKNGFDVGTNSPTYVDMPENDDVITCVVSSSHPCVNASSATSNNIKMKATFKKGRAIGIKVVPN